MPVTPIGALPTTGPLRCSYKYAARLTGGGMAKGADWIVVLGRVGLTAKDVLER